MPYHNRVAGARFTFGGRIAHLPAHPASLPHALHGMGSRSPWVMERATAQRADLLLSRAADRVWPWSFTARQVFDLDAQGLSVTLRLTNTDDAPMPGGVGWHPYLPRPVQICDDAPIVWPVGPDYLPGLAPVQRVGLTGDTLYLEQWAQVVAKLPNGLRLRFHQPVGLPHLVIHQPPGPFACIEPVSHLANALTQPGMRDMGPIVPGASLTARFRLEVGY